MLAERAGIELPKPKPRFHQSDTGFSTVRRPNPDSGADSASGLANTQGDEADYSSFSGKKTLHEAAAWAENQYYEYFRSLAETHPAKVYLNERGISPENVDKFRIGFAPDDWNWLEGRAKRKPKLLKDLATTGYLGFSDTRKAYYERFRGRLLFPIHDAQGRSVGIGGRVIPGIPTSNESAKYLNTPETPLFSKHRLLYGLDLAKPSIHKKKRVLVMEGYTDTIIAHQFGFTEAVAVLGTALGIDHIRTLNRLADSIYLVLDGDEPGQKRAAQVLELFVAEKVDVRILTLPEEDDPAEFLAEYGAEKFEELLQTRTNDALTHAFKLYTKGLEFSNIHQSEQALEKLLGLIASGTLHMQEKDLGTLTFREEKMLQQLAFSFSISEDFLRRRLKEIRGKAQHDAFVRESWQQKREQQEAIEAARTRIPGMPDANGTATNSGTLARDSKVPFDESEAFTDESSPFDDSFDPTDFGANQANFEFPKKAKAENGAGETVVFGGGETANDDLQGFFPPPETFVPNDFASEPSLLTREAFEAHADEVDWAIFGRINAWEKEIAEILLAWPMLLSEVRSRTTPERFQFVPARELFLRMCEMQDDGLEVTFERVLSSFESESMKRWMVQLDAESIWNHETKTQEQVLALLDQIMVSFERFHLSSRRPQDLSVFNSAGLNREQKLNLLDQLIFEKQRKNGIHPEENGEMPQGNDFTPNDGFEP